MKTRVFGLALSVALVFSLVVVPIAVAATHESDADHSGSSTAARGSYHVWAETYWTVNKQGHAIVTSVYMGGTFGAAAVRYTALLLSPPNKFYGPEYSQNSKSMAWHWSPNYDVGTGHRSSIVGVYDKATTKKIYDLVMSF